MMNKNGDIHIQLIQMIDDEVGPYFFAERTAPPLSLLSLATYLSKHLPTTTIEIFDNAVMNTREIHDNIGADIVGLSVNLWNYQKSLEVAKIAKEKGSTVVMGGHHASSVAENILRNRDYVDYIIIGDGEEAFTQLINGEAPLKINNIVYRIDQPSKIIRNKKFNMPLESIPIPDRSYIDLYPYIANYRKALPESPYNTYTTFYSHKGCNFRCTKGACVFCGIQIDGYRVRTPEECWGELSYLSEKYGINYVMDVGDNLTKGWLRTFIKEKPSDLKIAYTGYMRSDCIDNEVVELLAQIPCHSIFVGIESGDEEILNNSGKQTTPMDNLKAIQLLKNYGIKVRLGVILGLLGESEKSLSKTLNHIEDILSIGKIEGIYTSLMVPLPGSLAFTMLANYNGWKEKLLTSDLFDIESLKYHWSKCFSNTSYDRLIKVRDHIQSLVTPICQ